ncbi:hypothetical protein [Enhygromyxa salina]|nr:hypothetical protein [Enhygromyxa salina]
MSNSEPPSSSSRISWSNTPIILPDLYTFVQQNLAGRVGGGLSSKISRVAPKHAAMSEHGEQTEAAPPRLELELGYEQGSEGQIRFALRRGQQPLFAHLASEATITAGTDPATTQLGERCISHRLWYDEPIWLSFSSETLAAHAWEGLFAIKGPVLRKARVDIGPRFATHTPTIALCVSAQRDQGPRSVVRMVNDLLAILTQVGGCKVHVFVSSEAFEMLEDSRPRASTIVVHDPRSMSTDESSMPGRRNIWLRWMHERLSGELIHLVHFICSGWSLYDRGSLALEPLSSDGHEAASLVGGEELSVFLRGLGSLGLGLGRVGPDAVNGLRQLAHEMSRIWPGPVFSYDAPTRPRSLEAAFEFLLSPGPAEAPSRTDLSLYCSPARVLGFAALRTPLAFGGDFSYLTDRSLHRAITRAPSSIFDRFDTAGSASQSQVVGQANQLALDHARVRLADLHARGDIARAAGVEAAIEFVDGLLRDAGPAEGER